ncbi:MAG: hypothetical protein ACI9JN_001078 [Bacteroidia bacterium]|jgi:hypothetical protein
MRSNWIAKAVLTWLSVLLVTVVFGQHVLKKNITINADNEPLEQVLDRIEVEAGCVFAYPTEIVAVDKLVTVHATQLSVYEVLSIVLSADLKYKERGSYIIIQQKHGSKSSKHKYALSGKLVDAKSGDQISNASIYEVNKFKTTMSSDDGSYDLKLKEKSDYVDILVSKENYHDTLIRLRRAEIRDLVIELQPIGDSFNLVEDKNPVDSQVVVQMFMSDKTYLHLSNINLEQHKVAQVSFLPTLGTNKRMGGVTSNNLSFNALAGYSHSLNGLEIGGVANVTRYHVNGLQISGFTNFVGGRTNGIQVAGFSNYNNLSLRGIELAGFMNSSRSRVQGIQVSGFSNMSARMDGIQISGFLNSAWTKSHALQVAGFMNIGRDNDGGQIAGFLNVSTKKINGGQIAGFSNYGSRVNGAQISGLFNVALRSVDGVQIAGLLNYCTHLNGVQIGLINVCDTLESGINIGLLNIVRSGLFDLQLHHSSTIPVNLVFKTGSNRFYNMLSAGYHIDEDLIALGYGLGSRHIFKKGLVIGAEVQSSFLYKQAYKKQVVNLLNQFVPYLGYRWGKEIVLSAGPEINVYYSRLDGETGKYGFPVMNNVLHEEGVEQGMVQLSVGYRLGLSF